MGRRDEPELTPSEADLAEAEAATRQLLAPYAEPAPVEPPPGLAARVIAALPRPPEARRPAWAALRPLALWAAAASLLIALGALGALAAAPSLVSVAAGPDSALGRLSLALAATPVGDLLVGAGGVAALAILALVAGTWLWWRLARTRGDDER